MVFNMNKKEFIEKALTREKKHFKAVKLLWIEEGATLLPSGISNNWRNILKRKPLYSGIVTSDSLILNLISKSLHYSEKDKKMLFESSGEENYKRVFRYLLKTTENTPKEIEKILRLRFQLE